MIESTDEASECALLSLVIEDPSHIDKQVFSAGLFSGERRDLAKVFTQLRTKAQKITPENVRLISKNEELALLCSKLSTRQIGGSFELLADRCKEVRVRAKIASICKKHYEAAYDESKDHNQILAEFEKEAVSVRGKGSTSNLSYGSDVQGVMDLIAWRNENPDAIRGYSTGLEKLDDAIDGIQPLLYFLAARPSVGKTGIALQILLHVGETTGKRIVFLSAETSDSLIKARAISILSGVPIGRIGRAHTPAELRKINQAVERLAAIDFVIDDTSCPSIDHTENVMRRLSGEAEITMAVGDYVQLWKGRHGSKNSRLEDLCEISMSFKAISKNLNIPMLLLAQLQRPTEGVYDRDQKKTVTPKPQIHNLKSCSQFEQDADGIWLLHRNQEENSPSAELIIGKNRDGPLDTINLTFQPEIYTFRQA